MTLTLAFSPCPNDTFIFDALVHQKIDTEGLQFNVLLEDVETLNQWAIEGKCDITKISYGAYPMFADEYVILNSGSALGNGVGPLLVQMPGMESNSVETQTIALPGEYTTAHFLFTHAYPNATQKIFLRYDQIEDYVLQGKGPGVIIHENRFTYSEKGLVKLCDLGERWESATDLHIPLGGIVMKRTFPDSLVHQVNKLIRKSIEFARERYPVLTEYVTRNAQEMEESIMRSHIDLYVNDFSIDLGESGKNAIRSMMHVMGLPEDNNRFFTD